MTRLMMMAVLLVAGSAYDSAATDRDSEARNWAGESLPTVTAHLKRARELASGATASDAGQHR